MKKLTKKRIDEIAYLHQRKLEAESAYETAVNPFRRSAEIGVYFGTDAHVILSESERSTTNWAGVVKAAKVPPAVIKRYTKKKPCRRVDIVHAED